MAVKIVFHATGADAIKHDSLHVAVHSGFVHKLIPIADIQTATHVGAEIAEPADHIAPGKHDGDGHGLVGWVLRVPAIDRDGKTALAIIVRQHRRELLNCNVRWKFVPAIVVPGFGIQGIIVAGAGWVVPLPGIERTLFGMSGGQHLRDALAAFGFLIHGELVRPDRLIFVHAALDVPAREVSAIGARESSGAESTHGCTLPVAIINHSGRGERGLASAGIFERLADATLPCGFGKGVAGEEQRGENQ